MCNTLSKDIRPSKYIDRHISIAHGIARPDAPSGPRARNSGPRPHKLHVSCGARDGFVKLPRTTCFLSVFPLRFLHCVVLARLEHVMSSWYSELRWRVRRPDRVVCSKTVTVWLSSVVSWLYHGCIMYAFSLSLSSLVLPWRRAKHATA